MTGSDGGLAGFSSLQHPREGAEDFGSRDRPQLPQYRANGAFWVICLIRDCTTMKYVAYMKFV